MVVIDRMSAKQKMQYFKSNSNQLNKTIIYNMYRKLW